MSFVYTVEDFQNIECDTGDCALVHYTESIWTNKRDATIRAKYMGGRVVKWRLNTQPDVLCKTDKKLHGSLI